jgi:hypothetical protein
MISIRSGGSVIEHKKVFFFEKKNQKTFVSSLVSAFVFFLAHGALAQSDEDETGRDFPKTLVFDEPGIDDEVSLPTLVVTPNASGVETDADFELDKRLTERLSVQINAGYSYIGRAIRPAQSGWQNSSATLKYILFGDRAREQLVSFSMIREFGGSGAARVGASATGATTGAVNFGQGFARVFHNPFMKPFAVTGTVGLLAPDDATHGAEPQALVSASLQYSFDVLAATSRLPVFARKLIPIVEMTYAAPLQGHVHGRGDAAPGLIYAGNGFQLAAEALVPLTSGSGTHVGAIAQLNLSLSLLSVPLLARPVF